LQINYIATRLIKFPWCYDWGAWKLHMSYWPASFGSWIVENVLTLWTACILNQWIKLMRQH